MRYRSKIVEVEAKQLTTDNIKELEEWCKGSIKGVKLPLDQQVIDIRTLEGEMRANMGDFIIQGLKGEFYPCKPDIFHMKYEEVK
jgi:hypothetical protein